MTDNNFIHPDDAVGVRVQIVYLSFIRLSLDTRRVVRPYRPHLVHWVIAVLLNGGLTCLHECSAGVLSARTR